MANEKYLPAPAPVRSSSSYIIGGGINPVDLPELKRFLRVLGSADDGLILSLALAAQMRIEREINCFIQSATVTEYFDGFASDRIALSWRPVGSVLPLATLNNLQGTSWDTWHDMNLKCRVIDGIIQLGEGNQWPNIGVDCIRNVRVQYDCGWQGFWRGDTSIYTSEFAPEPLKNAIYQWTFAMYYGDSDFDLDNIKHLIQPYKWRP